MRLELMSQEDECSVVRCMHVASTLLQPKAARRTASDMLRRFTRIINSLHNNTI